MQIGMMGLGRMGGNMARRLMRAGHECIAYDVNPAAVETLVGEGAIGISSIEQFVEKLTPPRAVWIMLPAAITPGIVEKLAAFLQPGDIISTGTPPGVGLGQKPNIFLKAGDVVTLGIEGLGEQRQEFYQG